jgi:hypothetical protein
MRLKLLLVGLLGIQPSVVVSEQISRQSLVQYQYSVDVEQCNFNLSNGIRIEFGGVFANEAENIAFHELVVLGVKTERQFRYASVVKISRYDDSYFAKVVKQDGGRVFLALDATFLNAFWGSDGEGENEFTISDVDLGAEPQTGGFSLPEDDGAARLALSKGKTCYKDALAVD